MRVMVLIAMIVSVLAVGAGAAVITGGDTAPARSTPATSVGTDGTATQPGPAGGEAAVPTAPSITQAPDNPPTPTAGGDVAIAPTTTPASSQVLDLPTVAKPEFAAPVDPPWTVETYYDEWYTHDIFTIAWREGTFPPEKAEEIAVEARRALDRVNLLLGMSDEEPIEILLADRMFDDGCWGCQGYAVADRRQVFLLQDGSVAPEELPALLIHEIGHVVAIQIEEPNNLFFAEGLAMWIMTEDIKAQGYITPLQVAGWALKMGQLPSLEQLRTAKYEGRVRARTEYDGSASFMFYVIDSYGMDTYKVLYEVYNVQQRPDVITDVLDKDWATIEAEWHAYLQPYMDQTFNGITAEQWWAVAQPIFDAFGKVYDNPEPVQPEQWAALRQARLALNRGDLDTAVAYLNASDLVPQTAT